MKTIAVGSMRPNEPQVASECEYEGYRCFGHMRPKAACTPRANMKSIAVGSMRPKAAR